MAGSSDRYSRGRFVPALPISAAEVWQRSPLMAALGVDGWIAAVIAVHCVLAAVVFAKGGLDLAVAACLSAGLVALAGLVARLRSEDAGEVPVRVHALVAEAVPVAAVSPLAAGRVALDEHGQTWADLTARISHELRTPLNAVIGFSDLMEREIFGPLGNERYHDYAAHIRSSGEALLKSAEDTLALSALLVAPSAGAPVVASPLAGLATDAWQRAAALALARGVELDLDIAAGIDVAGDRRAVRQALSNLLVEAVQRSVPMGRVRVMAAVIRDTIRLSIDVPDAEAPLSVDPSLALCVARALLELQGTTLAVSAAHERGRWSATTVLDLAAQPDFFARPAFG